MPARSAAAAAVLAMAMVLAPFRPAAAEPNPVTPGDFRGYGFDQCLAPTQRAMDVWLNHSPFLSVGIYISGNSRACRSQPNLTPRLDRHPAPQGLAAAADHARAAGVVQRPLPALRRRPGHQRPTRPRRPLPRRPATGPRRGCQGGRRRQGAGDRPAQHALVRHRGVRPHELPLSRVGAVLPQRVDQQAARPQVRLRRLLERRVRDQGARRRPGRAPGRLHAARHDLDRALGRRREHVDVVHPRRRLAAGRPGEAVPGRARRDLGRRDHQHRPQLPRRRPRQLRAARGALRRGQPRLRPVPGAARAERRLRAAGQQGEGAAVPAPGARAVRRQAVGQVQPGDDRRRPGVAGEPRLPREHDLEPGQLGRRVRPGQGLRAEGRLDRPPRPAACNGPSTPPAPRSGARSPASSRAGRPRTSAPTSAGSASPPPASSTSARGSGCALGGPDGRAAGGRCRNPRSTGDSCTCRPLQHPTTASFPCPTVSGGTDVELSRRRAGRRAARCR